jgi:hypothetical protein
MTPEEKEQNYKLASQLLSEQKFGSAVIGGSVAAIIAAGIYAVVTVAMGYATAFLAIGIGVAVGFAVQYLGRGIETKFAVIASVLAVVGCVLGNIFASILFAARAHDKSLFEIAANIEIAQLNHFVFADFQLLDWLFWPLAIYAASFFAKRSLTRKQGLAVQTNENRPR